MAKINKSGVHYDTSGQLVLITQGLAGYTLVANKKILFRIYTSLASTACVSVLATVTYRLFGFKLSKTFFLPTSSLIIERPGLLGDSIGILFSGDMFPFPTPVVTTVDFKVYGNGSTTAQFSTGDMVFKVPGRVQLMIHHLAGRAPWGTQIKPDLSWLVEIFRSMERLNAMLPVRDGLALGLMHNEVGIGFIFGENLDPWPPVCPSGGPPPCASAEMREYFMRETEDINNAGTGERVDATVLWRPRDLLFPAPGGESVGGQAQYYDSAPGKGLAGLVGGNWYGKEYTGAILAQEVGHLFGLEPRESPHFEDPADGLHSKDPAHNDPFAFDFYLLKPYQPSANEFLGDVMNNSGGGLSRGTDMVLYNAFDWEYLRQKLVKLPGVARSSTRAKASSRSSQRELIATVAENLKSASPISVKNLHKGLASEHGQKWQWTARGFQPSAAPASEKRGVVEHGLTGLQDWLKEQKVSEFYAPFANRPLPIVINPNGPVMIDRTGFADRIGL